jgi:hypothetical protein
MHMGSKLLGLRDNRLKIIDNRTKIKTSYVQFTKIVKISPPVQCTDNPIKSKEFGS